MMLLIEMSTASNGIMLSLQENSQKQHIKCSHLVPKYPPKSKEGKLPCVVYCHCNSGSRRDSEEALHLLLPQNITVFSLDFVVSFDCWEQALPTVRMQAASTTYTTLSRVLQCVNLQHYA